MRLDYIRSEIELMRTQVNRQRGEIRQLQRAGIASTSAEALLERMLSKIDELCAERDRLKKDEPGPTKGKVLGGRRWLLSSSGTTTTLLTTHLGSRRLPKCDIGHP